MKERNPKNVNSNFVTVDVVESKYYLISVSEVLEFFFCVTTILPYIV